MLVKICCMRGETLEGVQTSEQNPYTVFIYSVDGTKTIFYNTISICWIFHSVQTTLYLKGNYVLKSIDIKYLFLSNVSQKDIFVISRTWSTHPTIIVLKRWLAAVTFYT